jgi:hypothetical protein
MVKGRKCYIFSSPSALSSARDFTLKTAPLYLVWQISFPALKMEVVSLGELQLFETTWHAISEN